MVYFNNWTAMSKMLIQLLIGTQNTVSIFCWTLVFSIPLGVLVSVGRMSKHGLILEAAARIYTYNARHSADTSDFIRILRIAAHIARRYAHRPILGSGNRVRH